MTTFETVHTKNTVQVIGLAEAERALSLIPEGLRRNTVLSALRKSVRPMVATARARAPKQANPKRRGGVSIGSFLATKWKLNKSLEQSIKAKALRARDPHLTEIRVGYGTGHFYGRFFELGTKASSARSARGRSTYVRRSKKTGKLKVGVKRARKARRGHVGLAARPFLGPAFAMHQRQIIESIGGEIGRSVERTARRVARQAVSGKLSKSARRALGGS